jgi:hypothetical protein
METGTNHTTQRGRHTAQRHPLPNDPQRPRDFSPNIDSNWHSINTAAAMLDDPTTPYEHQLSPPQPSVVLPSTSQIDPITRKRTAADIGLAQPPSNRPRFALPNEHNNTAEAVNRSTQLVETYFPSQTVVEDTTLDESPRPRRGNLARTSAADLLEANTTDFVTRSSAFTGTLNGPHTGLPRIPPTTSQYTGNRHVETLAVSPRISNIHTFPDPLARQGKLSYPLEKIPHVTTE